MTAIDPVPIDPVRQPHQLVFPVDDLLQPGAEQITDPAVSCFSAALLPPTSGITLADSRESRKQNCKQVRVASLRQKSKSPRPS
jgi:hypothetical protein